MTATDRRSRLYAAISIGILLALAGGAGAQSSLDSPEAAAMADAQFRLAVEPRAYAAPIGTVLGWANPVSGDRGTVVPIAEYRQEKAGPVCRDLTETVNTGGRIVHGVATGCQHEDGHWTTIRTTLPVTTYPAEVPADLPVDPENGPQRVPIAPVQIYGTIPGGTIPGGTIPSGTVPSGTVPGGTTSRRNQPQR
ncbi:MAG TPA: RT0821/Lpp0805 family surface protein [Stellaceae bacterium]|nr:RT0821/Lpp0805 family surface protein [Stellaceae bacterium]